MKTCKHCKPFVPTSKEFWKKKQHDMHVTDYLYYELFVNPWTYYDEHYLDYLYFSLRGIVR